MMSAFEMASIGYMTVSVIAFVVLFIKIRRLRDLVLRVADSWDKPVEPNEKLIELWKQKRDQLKPETPKWHAYNRRLIEVGAEELPPSA